MAVCCEVRDDSYEWVNSQNECGRLKSENERSPVSLSHNGDVYYCDEEAHNAIKDASDNLKDASNGIDESWDNKNECEDSAHSEYYDCMVECNEEHNCIVAVGDSYELCGLSELRDCEDRCQSTYDSDKNICEIKYGDPVPNYSSMHAALSDLLDEHCD